MVGNHPLSPEEAEKIGPGVLTVNADWGIKANGKAVRPRLGKICQRPYTPNEIEILSQVAQQNGFAGTDWPELFGSQAIDAYLNQDAHWTGIPEKAWTYTIGGRQVLPKWLSYREHGKSRKEILGRPLTSRDCHQFTDIAHRLLHLRITVQRLDARWGPRD